MKKFILLAALLVIVMTTPALAQTQPANGIQGFITDISGTVMLVEVDPTDESGSAKGTFTITDDTEILRQQGDEQIPATFEDLQVGQLVAATYIGPVAESYPTQGMAGSIVILEEPSGDEPLCMIPEGCGPEGLATPAF